jgi:hypothetical protein
LLIYELRGARAATAHRKTLFIDYAPANRAIGHERNLDALLLFAIAQRDAIVPGAAKIACGGL